MMRCPMCKYYRMHINQDRQSSVEAAKNGVLQSSHFCTHPEVIRIKGDGVNPFPIDKQILRIANERYRSVPRAAKWDRSPATFYLTDNVLDIASMFKIIDDEDEYNKDLNKKIWDIAIPIQAKMQELGITSLNEATPEQREIILGIRESATEERAYEQRKVNIHQWIALQLWDEGCDLGARRFDSNDETDTGLKVKVTIR